MSSHSGLLTINVVRAKELRNSGSVHTPYVTITIGNVSERTNASSNPQAPEWNQSLAFSLNPDVQQAHVVVTVPHVEQPIGEATIPLSELISHAFQPRWYAIHDIHDKNYSTGIIQLEVFHDPDHIAPKQAPIPTTNIQSQAPPSYAHATGVSQHGTNVQQPQQQPYQPTYAQPPQQVYQQQPQQPIQYQPPPAYVQPQQSPYQPQYQQQPQYQARSQPQYQPVYQPQPPPTVVYQQASPTVVYQQPAPPTVVVQQGVIVRRPAPVIAAPVLGVGAGLAAGAVLGGIFGGHHHHHHHHGFGFGHHHHHRHHRW